MKRSEFIRTCCLAAAGSVAASLLLESCGSSVYFASASVDGNRLRISKQEFINGNKQRKFVVIKNAGLKFPIGIFRFSDNEYSALLMECTHKGCELNPAGDHLVCPCHGSEFSAKGVVLSPPANKNLRSFPVTVNHDEISIEI